jgi:hypothetical protein
VRAAGPSRRVRRSRTGDDQAARSASKVRRRRRDAALGKTQDPRSAEAMTPGLAPPGPSPAPRRSVPLAVPESLGDPKRAVSENVTSRRKHRNRTARPRHTARRSCTRRSPSCTVPWVRTERSTCMPRRRPRRTLDRRHTDCWSCMRRKLRRCRQAQGLGGYLDLHDCNPRRSRTGHRRPRYTLARPRIRLP